MDKNSFLVLRDIYAHKHETIREIAKSVNLSLGLVHSTKNILLENGYIDSNSSITKKGIDKLEEYRVKSAIILAAGLSTRFAPLSFDKPKGLLEVNGEILIERQIRQLKEAGIETSELIIAVTSSDETNITACQIADTIFNVKTKIARISQTSYLD